MYGRAYWSGARLVQGPVDFLLSWVVPAVVVVWLWVARQATPGKMAIGARIVDAETGENASGGLDRPQVALPPVTKAGRTAQGASVLRCTNRLRLASSV